MPLARFVREVARQTATNRMGDVAAQLAFHSLLALFPFLIFLLTILGLLPIDGLSREILRILRHVMPHEASQILERIVHQLVQPHAKLFAVSLLGAMVLASNGMTALTGALNRAYSVEETRSWVRVRLQSLAVTVAAALLLTVAAVALLIGPRLVAWIADWFGLGGMIVIVWRRLRWPAIVLAMSLLLAMVYWACPDVRQRFRLLTPGSLVAVPLWIACSLAFDLYVTHLGTFDKTYGALGAVVVLLVWIYLSSFIVLIGGEMNAVLERWSREGR